MAKTNDELRRLKSLHLLSINDLLDLLTSAQWGGPTKSTIEKWLGHTSYNVMPANSLDLFLIRLKESGYTE